MGVKQYIEYEYSEDNVNWHSLLTSLDYYQRERTVTDTDGVLTYSGFTAGVLVRVDGETPVFGVDYRDGIDGQFVSYAYFLKATNPASPVGGSFDGTVETYPTDPDTGNSWSDNLIAPGNNQYVWVSRTVYKKDGNDEWVNIDWTYPVRFTGLNGSVPVIGEDYFNGTLGVYTSFIFHNSVSIPATPIGGTFNGSIETYPVGSWTDNPVTPPVGEVTWVSKTHYTQDVSTGLWTNIGWSVPSQFSGHQGYTPIIGVDFFDAINGTFTSYAFKLSTLKPATPTAGSFSVIFGVATEIMPDGWDDDITSPPDGSYIWITKRIYTETNGSWIGSTWTEPAKFSGEHGYTPVYGTDYTDGTSGIYTSYVFRSLSGVPLVPLGGTYDGAVETMPSDQVGGFWADDPIAPLVGERVWVSIARYENDVQNGTWSKSGWSIPVKFNGEKGQYRKNLYQRKIVKPVDDPDVAPLDWLEVPPTYLEGDGMIWMAFAEFSGNDERLTDWTIVLVETFDLINEITGLLESIDIFSTNTRAELELQIQSIAINAIDGILAQSNLNYITAEYVESINGFRLEINEQVGQILVEGGAVTADTFNAVKILVDTHNGLIATLVQQQIDLDDLTILHTSQIQQSADDITALVSTIGGTDFDLISIRLKGAENAIVTSSVAITNSQIDLINRYMDGSLTAYDLLETAQSVAVAETVLQTLSDENSSQASLLTVLGAKADQAIAGYEENIIAIASEEAARTTQVSELSARVGVTEGDIEATLLRVDSVEVLADGTATAFDLVEGAVNDPTTGLSATYTVANLAQTTADGTATAFSITKGLVDDPTTGLSAGYNLAQLAKTTADGAATSATNITNTVNNVDTGLSATFSLAGLAKTTADGAASSATSITSTVNHPTTGLAQAFIGLEAVTGDVEGLQANAFLVASTTVGGFTRVAGVKATAGALTTNLAFVGDQMQWLDNAGNIGLTYDSTAGGRFRFYDYAHFDLGLSMSSTAEFSFGSAATASKSYFESQSDGMKLGRGNGFNDFKLGYQVSTDTTTLKGPSLRLQNTDSAKTLTLEGHPTYGIEAYTSTYGTIAQFNVIGGVNRLYVPNGYGFFTRNGAGSSAPLHAVQLGTGDIATFRQGGEGSGFIVANIDNSGVFNTLSDINNKIIESTEHTALSKLNSIGKKGYIKYKLKSQSEGKSLIGLIAQDIENEFPELVSTINEEDPNNITKGVNYTGLIGPLLVALAEVTERLEALESSIAKEK
jgi:hypothetical protein